MTVRDRDSLTQERVAIDALGDELERRLRAPWRSPKLERAACCHTYYVAVAADQVSYQDLYARWEQGNWSATELDFSVDREQWQNTFTEFERRAALWTYSMFFHGEDSVADNLSPYIDAAATEEQKYFLATQQVDEARHAVLFGRFMREVAGAGHDIALLARGDAADADVGFSQGLRPPRQDGRRAPARSLQAEARAGDHALPPDHRGDARPARPALHRRRR